VRIWPAGHDHGLKSNPWDRKDGTELPGRGGWPVVERARRWEGGGAQSQFSKIKGVPRADEPSSQEGEGSQNGRRTRGGPENTT